MRIKLIHIILFYAYILLYSSKIKADTTIVYDYSEQALKVFHLPDSIKEKAIFDTPEYQYKPVKPKQINTSWWDRFKRFLERLFMNLDLSRPDGTKSSGNIWKWILFVSLLAVAIYLFIKSPFISIIRSKKRVTDVNFEAEEIQMSEASIDDIIQQSELNSDYKKAIRYQLLKLLKYLSESRQIEWESHKTNQDFINEITHKETRDAYKSIAQQYDLVWYGERIIDDKAYEEIKRVVNKQCYHIYE
jgi:hypothetical protein